MGKARCRVSIVIPNYDGKEDLKRLLPSIASQTFDDYEVIIIDDCSPDRSVVEYIKVFVRDHDNMRLLENEKNMGFVRTCNRGFELADGDYICLLTNDTEVKRDFLERNVQIMDADKSIGVLSCVIIDQSGDNWFTGGMFRAGLATNMKDDFQGVRSVDWVAGTAPFYRREVFDKIGLLSEDFRMYHEDIDFCLRVSEETDYRVCVFAEKLVMHHSQRLEPGPPNLRWLLRVTYYTHRNHIMLLKRHSPQHIPKVLLLHFEEIIRLPTRHLLGLRLKTFLLSIPLIGIIVAGTLAGLITRRSQQ